MTDTSYSVKSFPKSRLATVHTTARARRLNTVHGLLEFDVTEARALVHRMRRSGVRVSFKAWLIHQIAVTLIDYPELHSMRQGGKQWFFHSVDVAVVMERTVGEDIQALPALLKNAEKLSAPEINEKIEAFKKEKSGEDNLVLGSGKVSFLAKLFIRMPGFLQRFLFNFVLNRPRWAHSMMGSVMVSNLSPFARLNAWGIPLTMHPLTFLTGAVVEKAVVRKGEIVKRKIMNLTVSFNHDVVDGAQMGRFITALSRRIENPATASFVE